jgi:hypothetical protein
MGVGLGAYLVFFYFTVRAAKAAEKREEPKLKMSETSRLALNDLISYCLDYRDEHSTLPDTVIRAYIRGRVPRERRLTFFMELLDSPYAPLVKLLFNPESIRDQMSRTL